MTLAVALATGAGPGESRKRTRETESDDPLTLERVARYPPPGGRIPGTFRFSHDERYLYYLAGESGGVVQSLMREDVASGERQVVARAPQEDPATGLTPEEVLRRERRRIQDKGITLYGLAARAEVAVFDWRGDVFLARPGQDALRLTQTPASEIDPQVSPDGTRLAFARDGELYVMDLATRAET